MRMVITDSALMARTIWSAFGDPDGTVVVPIDVEFAGLSAKGSSFDESNDFSPVWGILKESAFRSIARQARKAEEIVLGHRDDWCASLTEESLRTAGVTAPIRRVRFADLHPAAIREAIRTNVDIDRKLVDLGWRQRIADRIISDATSKPLKKIVGVDWEPTLDGLFMLRRISQACLADQNGKLAQTNIDPKMPTMLCALIRGATHNSPAVIAEHIRDLIDYGLLTAPTDRAVEGLRDWCVENLGDSRIDLSDVDQRFIDSMLLPMNAAADLKTIQPAYRDTYTDIWQHAIHYFSPTLKVKESKIAGRWWAEAANIFTSSPAKMAATMGQLREAGLVFGWSYVMPTDTGMLVLAALEAGWPTLSDTAFLARVTLNVNDLQVSRGQALGALMTAAQSARDISMPESMTYCPKCRSPLRAMMNQRRLRLVCQNSACSRIWPCEREGQLLRPLLAHDAPRWCAWCGLTIHAIDVDEPTQSARQTCKECKRSQTY